MVQKQPLQAELLLSVKNQRTKCSLHFFEFSNESKAFTLFLYF